VLSHEPRPGQKIKVAILFGGKSVEHEVSIRSAKNIIHAIDKKIYDIVLIGIDKQGRWLSAEKSATLLNDGKINTSLETEKMILTSQGDGKIIATNGSNVIHDVDVVFPVLHGPFGEDGTVQGLLKLANIPFVGAGVIGSAIGMDKDVMKRLLRDAGIPVAKFLVYKKHELGTIAFKAVTDQLGLPFFVKPANLGSSVGISKVHNETDFAKAVSLAFDFDTKILIEENIVGREIECSVLGNENPIASVVGEIIPHDQFYSYDAKYIHDNGAELRIPAILDSNELAHIQACARKTFEVLCCEGMARVDFFLAKDGTLYVNEINTIPGFTYISMYPKLWEQSGIQYAELIDRLIKLAIDRYQQESKLKTTFE
jgi:D-alanine-D-alanine ligase